MTTDHGNDIAFFRKSGTGPDLFLRRRIAGAKPGIEELSYDELVDRLATKGVDHIAYYHYTRWNAFRKIMAPVRSGPAKGHRLFFLTSAKRTNDGLEEKWDETYFMACFSQSRYEDVAMWLNYGKRKPDAVRFKITRDAFLRWEENRSGRHAYRVLGRLSRPKFEDVTDKLESVRLYAVAYVIPSQHWVTEEDGVGGIVQDGNVELGRKFYKVSKGAEGRRWVDRVYRGTDLRDILPVFKKRGWAYEREIRLVAKLRKPIPGCERIAVAFDEPLEELNRFLGMSQDERERTPLGGRMTKKIKVWDRRVPIVQSGPWYKPGRNLAPVNGFRIDEAFPSEYKEEIKIFR